jgi:AcrR family transcriptional regulator
MSNARTLTKPNKNLKRKIALYHVIGYSTSKIAKACDVSSSTVYRYLHDEDTQKMIQSREEDIYEAVERKYRYLLKAAVDRLHSTISDGGDEVALKAVEMVMKMDGRLGDAKAQQQEMLMQQMLQEGGMVGSFAIPADKAERAMSLLNDTRDDKTDERV